VQISYTYTWAYYFYSSYYFILIFFTEWGFIFLQAKLFILLLFFTKLFILLFFFFLQNDYFGRTNVRQSCDSTSRVRRLVLIINWFSGLSCAWGNLSGACANEECFFFHWFPSFITEFYFAPSNQACLTILSYWSGVVLILLPLKWFNPRLSHSWSSIFTAWNIVITEDQKIHVNLRL